MRIAEHWVATTRGGERGLTEPEPAAWLWHVVSRAVPTALAFLISPDHLHLMAPPGFGEPFRRRLSCFTRKFGTRFDLLPAEPANSPRIALRQIRYALFNPVRAGLVEDPWCWRWSTLRDLGGACFPIWTPVSHVSAALDMAPARTLSTLTSLADHRPEPPRQGALVAVTFEAIRGAVAAVLRQPDHQALSTRTGRTLAVQACHAVGGTQNARLAASLGCSLRTIDRARQPPHPALDAVLRCLMDDRLRR
ncbi:MAG: hypothetical protein R3B72_49050 [Polyangiaceae bacterium]